MMHFVQNFPFFSIFLPILCGVICLLLGNRAAKWVTFVCYVIVTVLSAMLLAFTLRTGESFVYLMGKFPAPFGNELRIGPFEAFMAMLFSSVHLLSFTGGLRDAFADIPENKINLHFLLLNLLIGAMFAIIYTNDIFTAYVFIEVIVIAACAIICTKPSGRSILATMSYLMMTLIGSGMMLLGIAMLYGVTGHLLFPGLQAGISALVASGQFTVPLFVLTSLFVVAFAIKSAMFPFHGWLPDAHASATTSTSAILSGLVVKVYIVLFVRMAHNMYSLEIIGLLGIPHLMLGFGLAGIVYGSWKAMRQKNVKLMLSYASIASVGYIYAAVALNTTAGIAAASFHIAVHAAGKAMLFTAVGGLAAVSGGHKDFDSLLGAARRDPLSGAAFIVGGLSMIGIPPFSGFASKLYVTTSAVGTPYAVPVILVAVIGSTVLATMYYFPAIAKILSKPGELSGETADFAVQENAPASLLHRATLVVFLALNLFFGLFSAPVIRVIEQGLAALG